MVVEWGTPGLDDELYDSHGDAMTSAITWQLGVFGYMDEFDVWHVVNPTTLNPWEYKDYWVVFDQANFELSNPLVAPMVQGYATIDDDGYSSYRLSLDPGDTFNFSGLDAYVWAFNTQNYEYGLEWLIYRGSGLGDEPAWTFPEDPTSPPEPEAQWIADDLNLTDSDEPVWGNQNGIYGGTSKGAVASNPQLYPGYEYQLLQTYTIVPEPGTYAVGVILMGLGALQWWRKKQRGQTENFERTSV